MTCECKRYPGKFEGEPPATMILYEATLAGCADEECGPYALYRAPILPDAKNPTDDELQSRLVDEGYCQDCIKDSITYLQKAAGAITHQSDRGFETHETFNTKEDLEACWTEIESNYAPEDD